MFELTASSRRFTPDCERCISSFEKVSLSLHSCFSAKVVSGVRDTNHVVLLPMKTKFLNASIDAAYIGKPSWCDCANINRTIRVAGFDKADKLVVCFFK